jgi:hypothetical protein
MEQSGNKAARSRAAAYSEEYLHMKVIEGTKLAEFERFNELYRPIAEWCDSLNTARPEDDVTGWFYRAFDKIVRHPDFKVDDLRQVLTANWFDFAEGPGAMEQIEDICASAFTVRRYIEAMGQVEMRDPSPKNVLKVVAPPSEQSVH